MALLEQLDKLDKKLFLFLNGFHNSFGDVSMIYISKTYFWIPLYALFIYFIIKYFKKRTYFVLIAIALAVTLADQISSSFMKPYFERFRPCKDEVISRYAHIVDGCGSKYGFVSSHAANTFAVATLLFLLFRRRIKGFGIIFLWAVIVSFSRVYLGKHYPGDVLGGGVLGILIAFILYYLYQYFDRKINTKNQNKPESSSL